MFRRLLILILLLVALFTQGRSVVSRALSNVAYLTMNQNKANELSSSTLGALFDIAGKVDSSNLSALKGLGYTLVNNESIEVEKAVGLWQSVPGMSSELIAWGRRAENAGTEEGANHWYRLAAMVDPEESDPWYHIGLLFDRTGDLEAARDAYLEGVKRPKQVDLGLSDFYFRLGRLDDRSDVRRDLLRSLSMYDYALEIDDFSTPWFETQTRYYRAETLRHLDRDAEARQEYELVIELAPDHYWAHVHLANLIWELDEDSASAEQYYKDAILIDPNNKWAYRGLGNLYCTTGRVGAAQAAVEQVLAIDPDDTVAEQILSSILDETDRSCHDPVN